MRALIIDDSRAMRMILKRVLCEIGFDVTEAANGREGLTRLKDMPNPDLVTVDWDMPVMDGLSFVQAVRSDPVLDQLPVIMVTRNNDLEQVTAALEAGANEYVMKPFTEEVIREKLELMGIS